MTPRPVERAARPRADDRRPVARFDRVERVAHWLNALGFFVLMLSGLALYFEPVIALVGRRRLFEDIHVYTGVALPLPLLVSVAGYWGRGLRADISRLNRWIPDDRTWLRVSLSDPLRRRRVRAQLRLGKFNAGQKLNAAFTLAAIGVMLGTGIIMKWYHPYPLAWRTGATFVHDWLAVGIVVVVLGHIRFAVKDPEALRSIFSGTVTRGWAKVHAPGWLVEVEAAATPALVGTTAAGAPGADAAVPGADAAVPGTDGTGAEAAGSGG